MSELNSVPCNGCELCCISPGILLKPEDYDKNGDPRFITSGVNEIGVHYLGFDEKLSKCVYLSANGCVIQKDKPETCKKFDCRLFAVAMSKAEAVRFDREKRMDFRIWQKGKDLILEQFERDL
jgi:uncharacterized protein